MSSSFEDLQNEHNEIAQRVADSKAEADEIRNQLQGHQDTLSNLEDTVATLQQAVTNLQIQKAEIEKQETQAKHTLNESQKHLQEAHQKAAQLAQALGASYQKQKQFEEALSTLATNLQNHSSKKSSSTSLPKPPSFPGGGLPKPSSFPGGGLPKPSSFPGGGLPKPSSQSSSLHLGDEPRLTEINPALSMEEKNVPPREPSATQHDASSSERSFQSSKGRMPRFEFQTQAKFEVKVDGQSTHNFYTGFTQNISEGGLFIATGEVIDVGTEIAIKKCHSGIKGVWSETGLCSNTKRKGTKANTL